LKNTNVKMVALSLNFQRSLRSKRKLKSNYEMVF